jgi:pimeloyl-ACP methyl ester carboxylesterase
MTSRLDDASSSFEALTTRLFAEHGVAVSSRFLGGAVEDRPIHVLEAGAGPPLVFIHGGGSYGGEWAGLIARLQRRFRCIAIDRPGHGLSYRVDYGDVPDYRADAAAFVGRALDLLGLPRATLVACSMGGFFAFAFALARPDRVDRLVMTGAPAGVDRWLPLALRLLGMPVLGPLLWKTVARPSAAGLRRLFEQLLVADARKVGATTIACLAAMHALPGADVAWLSLLRRFATPRGVDRRCYLRDDLAGLEVPTMFVWGDRDAAAPPTSGQGLCRTMPDARITIVPEAGHLPWIDAPDTCADAIERFLEIEGAARAQGTKR